MTRRLFTLAAAASAVLCFGTVAVTVVTLCNGDARWQTPDDRAASGRTRTGPTTTRSVYRFHKVDSGGFGCVETEEVAGPYEVNGDKRRLWFVPSWPLTLAASLPPLGWLVAPRRAWPRFLAAVRRHAARRHDLCPACGYDLRASATQCPECGRYRTDTVHATVT